MRNSNLQKVVKNSILAALYVAITLVFSPISYGFLQFRISEMLIMLPFFNKKWIPGIVLGTLIANMFSPLGLVDVVFGTLATLISVLIISRSSSNLVAVLVPTIVNGIVIGVELNLLFNSPLLASILYIAASEMLILTASLVIFRSMLSNKVVSSIIGGN